MSKKTKSNVGSSNYDKLLEAIEDNDIVSMEEEIEVNKPSRKTEQAIRPERKKVYKPTIFSEFPPHVVDKFAKDNYEIRWVRFSLDGQEDLRNLSTREMDGYEFVEASELPEDYLHTLRLYDGKMRQGLVTNGKDACLMKVDVELRNSRRDFYRSKTEKEIQAADLYSKSRRDKSLVDLGMKSTVSFNKEPTFQQ